MEIFKYMVSQTDIPDKITEELHTFTTPLQAIIYFCKMNKGNRKHDNCIEMVKILLANIQNIDAQNGFGLTALDVARQFNVLDVIRPSKKRKYK